MYDTHETIDKYMIEKALVTWGFFETPLLI